MDYAHTYLAYRAATHEPLAVTAAERARHIHVIGATGMGKSTLLHSIAVQDIARGDGLMLIDPHGDLAEAVLDCIPKSRSRQVCYLSPSDLARPVGLNVLDSRPKDERSLAIESVISGLRAIWPDSWGPRMEDILRYSLLALIEMPSASLAVLPRFLVDDRYRQRVLTHTTDSFTRAYFANQFERIEPREREQRIAPILNKIGAFLAAPAIRNILGQATSTIDLGHMMNNRQIVIANLATGRLGETPSALLGALLVAHLKTAAMARAAVPYEQRTPFHLIADEIELFGTEIFASLLSEARKYRLSLTLANQHRAQLSTELAATLIANAATTIAFSLGAEDAALYAKEFQIDPSGLQDLSTGQVVLNGRAARLYPRPESLGTAAQIMAQSAYRFGRDRKSIEQKLLRALNSVQ